ncbi:DUF1127 domain-containing protein [Acuticoccus sp. I52.16.1]|uniref:DUF1127 domain-containing protein n=1 Tax=Acuticoccus sp. I52.16.1 TaxID=2928472 RepID=UPI001FD40530|nr:DUF1127 domain-containing protein [Acuticoccus sp. I52.16.1]UOM36401.1 DUF1127 domain-containing protein [Acuticoccus sp. I52.16.1]
MEHVLSHLTLPTTGWIKRTRIVGLWLDVWTERRHLERLDARMLADIGLTDVEARTESKRRAWDVPPQRMGW